MSNQTQTKKIEEPSLFADKLEKYDVEIQHERAETAKKFDLKGLAEVSRQKQVVVVPNVGEMVFCTLTTTELNKLPLKDKSNTQVVELISYAMLKKADPSINFKDWQDLSFDIKTAVMQELSKTFTRFLPNQPKNGSSVAQKPK